MEELLLFNISNKALKTYVMGFGGGLGSKSFDFREGWLLMPVYPNIKYMMNYLFVPLKPALRHLYKNVCFLDIDDKYDNVKTSCDWCSIINGIMETTKQNIIKNPKITKQIDFEKLKMMNKRLDFILDDRTEKLRNQQIEEWCENIFGEKSIDLLLLSQLYLKFEMVELRWCPFKRSKEFYYRNKDKRYLEPSEKMIYEVGKILSNYETITCNNCPKVVNENWKYTQSNKQSIFQPLLDYMMEEIAKNLEKHIFPKTHPLALWSFHLFHTILYTKVKLRKTKLLSALITQCLLK